ncbi:unnamed protein product [Bursaphelenchus xylophilus]|uniref:Beta-sarcoglycan n=1 Tax=Bursaphelenchus xylophilus TaxID=6326 RepID=A0A1I7RZX1_BURXY|nr:unnamed protein product [Bursaphelenchus xylophilus]CAG9109167.1 unnamed protein product [Bursaphelenchus xylophilus]
MASPRYLRRLTDGDRFPAEKADSLDLQQGSEKESTPINVTGLREHRLIILIIWILILFIFAILILAFNITLIRVLKMSPRGMEYIKVHSYNDEKTGKEETIVYMSAKNIDLGHVVTNTGHVIGPKAQTMNIQGSRVLIKGGVNKTEFLLQDGVCRFDLHENFLVTTTDGRTLFSAQHPMVTVDSRIKKVSTSKIITNKVRSPINQPLKAEAENVILRGNQGVKLEGKTIRFNASTSIGIKTEVDGAVRFNSRKVYLGNRMNNLPISSSPSLTASIEAYRVCVCVTPTRPKLFITRGNKPCGASSTICP